MFFNFDLAAVFTKPIVKLTNKIIKKRIINLPKTGDAWKKLSLILNQY